MKLVNYKGLKRTGMQKGETLWGMVTFRSILLFSVLKKQNQTNNAIQEEEPKTESK